MQVYNPSVEGLKCPTCRISFKTEDEHKAHYKSDYHRYNLKRTMVNLPPATFEQFSSKKREGTTQRKTTFQCGECRKVFSSYQTLNQHAISKGHNIDKQVDNDRRNSAQKSSVSATKSKQPASYKPDATRCLFCLNQSQNIEKSLQHMELQHGFFIPQRTYCIDVKGLLLYLQEKIEVGMLCINCENKGTKDFATGEAVRRHMISKSHVFMKVSEGYEEYEDFYDFSEQFKQKLQEQRGRSVMGINYEKVKVLADEHSALEKKKKGNVQNSDEEWMDEDQAAEEGSNSDGDDGQWQDETDSENSMIEEEDDQESNSDYEKATKGKKYRKVKAYQIMVPTLTPTDELLLPNGKTLGHRKYRSLYRQTVRLNTWIDNSRKMIENGGASAHQLAVKQNIMEQIKKENLMKNYKKSENKKVLKYGLTNNNQKFFRTSCSMG